MGASPEAVQRSLVQKELQCWDGPNLHQAQILNEAYVAIVLRGARIVLLDL